MKNILAVDMGATSIRVSLGKFNNKTLNIEEILRFSHKRVIEDGRSRWDWKKIIGNIIGAIKKYGKEIDAIGIDTWGVDFACLDIEGNIIENPVSYRDSLNQKGYEIAITKMSEKDIYFNSGNQIMSINSLFQIEALRLQKEDQFEKIHKILPLPDYINYLLCGNMFIEESIASTMQILDLSTQTFSDRILNNFELRDDLFSNLIKAGEIIGSTKNSKIEELRQFDIPVVSIASHDTASAVMLTEAFIEDDVMFLSCGTWSLIGCLTEKAIITEESYENELTNEIGYDSSNMFFKNITGLYLVEKMKEKIEEKRTINFDEITEYVENNMHIEGLIDVSHSDFAQDSFDIVQEINKHLEADGYRIPNNDMDYFSIIYNSLVDKYSIVKADIEKITEKKFRKVHIIGGGSKSRLLCQMIADRLNVEVISGPAEATLLGNIIVQLIATGEIKSLTEGREIINNIENIKIYKPSNNA